MLAGILTFFFSGVASAIPLVTPGQGPTGRQIMGEVETVQSLSGDAGSQLTVMSLGLETSDDSIYDFRGLETYEGFEVYRIEVTPRKPLRTTPVVHYWIHKDSHTPLRIEQTQDGKVIGGARVTSFQKKGNRWQVDKVVGIGENPRVREGGSGGTDTQPRIQDRLRELLQRSQHPHDLERYPR